LGVLWVLSGGPERSDSGSGFGKLSTGEGIVMGLDNFFIPITRDSQRSVSDVDKEYDRIIEAFGRTRDFGETSPYWGLITIKKSSSGPKQTSTQNEYITLEASYKLTEPLTITDWKLQSMITNETVTVPEATKVSTSGNVNIEQPIVVSPRDVLYLITGHSPIGTSFQINKCSGYFEQFQNFTPAISRVCPTPEDEFMFSVDAPLGELYDVSVDIVNDHAGYGGFDPLIYMLSKLSRYTIYQEKPYPDTVYQVKLREDDFVFQFVIQGERTV